MAQWSVVLKLYCVVSECNAASTLFLSTFFWGFVARQVGATSDLHHMMSLCMIKLLAPNLLFLTVGGGA